MNVLRSSEIAHHGLQAQLSASGHRPNFDMDDEPDLKALQAFRHLHAGVSWLSGHVTAEWRAADASARQHQARHRTLARLAVATGVGAVILVIAQLGLGKSWPEMIGPVAMMEAVIVLACVISVSIGLWAKSDRNWLVFRHRAELLRMLKFRALARADLWNGHIDRWKASLLRELHQASLPSTFAQVESWARQDAFQADPPPPADLADQLEERAALVIYYREKRLRNQADYFRRTGDLARANLSLRFRDQREWLFFLTVGCVILHFGADYAAKLTEGLDASHRWEIAATLGAVLAAALPVAGMGMRAWSAVFELSRKARSFDAKARAMIAAADRLRTDAPWHVVLAHITTDEVFLEQEHRDWLRLMLDAEWFV